MLWNYVTSCHPASERRRHPHRYNNASPRQCLGMWEMLMALHDSPQHHPSQYTRGDIEPLARESQRLRFYTPHHRVPDIFVSHSTLASLVLLSVQPIHSAEISSEYSPPQSSYGPWPPAAPLAVQAFHVSGSERCPPDDSAPPRSHRRRGTSRNGGSHIRTRHLRGGQVPTQNREV